MKSRSRWKRLGIAVGAVALPLISGACASSGAVGRGPVPKPFPMPGKPSNTEPADSTARRPEPGAAVPATDVPRPSPRLFDSYALVGTALDLRGAPYRDGGNDPRGFDCSGFTQYVYARHGLALPRATRDQFSVGAVVDRVDLAPGDLLFFSTTAPGASHVAIAVGTDQFVHAPSSTGVVRVERLSSGYWSRRFIGARRIRADGAP